MTQGSTGLGRGWTRVAEALAARVPAAEINRLWIFPPIRKEEREWGTAVATRPNPDGKLEILTARYMLIVRGREKGDGKVEVTPVGTSDEFTLESVLEGVQERSGQTEPPEEISPDVWYGEDDDEPAA